MGRKQQNQSVKRRQRRHYATQQDKLKSNLPQMPKISSSSRLSKIQTFIQSVGTKPNPTNPKRQKIKKPSPKTRLKKQTTFLVS